MAMLLALAEGQLLEFGAAVGVFPYERESCSGVFPSELRMTHWTLGETNREQLTEKVSILILYIPSRLERQIILFYCKMRKHRERRDRTKQQKREPMISYSKNRETGLKQKPIYLVLTQRKRQENWGHRHSVRRTCPAQEVFSPFNSTRCLKASTFKLLLKIPFILN